jgi:hypothetical protein
MRNDNEKWKMIMRNDDNENYNDKKNEKYSFFLC